MGRQKKAEVEDEADDIGTHKIKRELTPDEIDERRDRHFSVCNDIDELEAKRTIQSQKINFKLKDLKAERRKLQQEVRDAAEWVDAQMTLEEANKSRKAVVRSVQPPAP